GIRSKRGETQSGRNRRGASAAGTARYAGPIPRIETWPIVRIIVRNAIGELVQMCFAEKNRAGGFQSRDDGAVKIRHEIPVNRRSPRGFNAPSEKQIFYGNRHAMQRTTPLARADFSFGGARLFPCFIRRYFQERVYPRIETLDARKHRLRHFDRR